MPTDDSATTRGVAAALRLVLEPGDFAKVFPDGPSFSKKEDALGELKASNCLSKNQRTAIFAYLYIYAKLSKTEEGHLAKAQSALTVQKGVLDNLAIVISEERIDYIRKLYGKRNQNYTELFIEPDTFIVQIVEKAVMAEVPEEKKKLAALKASEYEHEADRTALEELKSFTTLSSLVKKYNEYAFEKMEIVRLTGSGFQVTEKNMPYVHKAMQDVCRVLDVHKVPKLYLGNGGINAYTVGKKDPIVCLNNGSLSLLTHDELLFLLGHEVGHIKSGHFLYHSMASHLTKIGSLLGDFTMGLGSLLTKPLELALLAWYRKSELTADRAGLLACQSPNAAYSFFTKLAGYPLKYYGSINSNDIMTQARTFEDLDKESYNQFAKFLSVMDSTHPWTIMRAKELDRWVSSGRYKGLINQKAVLGATHSDSHSLVTVCMKSDQHEKATTRVSVNPERTVAVSTAVGGGASVLVTGVRPSVAESARGAEDPSKSKVGISIGPKSDKPTAGKTGITIQLKK